jgi:hypothetical protein
VVRGGLFTVKEEGECDIPSLLDEENENPNSASGSTSTSSYADEDDLAGTQDAAEQVLSPYDKIPTTFDPRVASVKRTASARGITVESKAKGTSTPFMPAPRLTVDTSDESEASTPSELTPTLPAAAADAADAKKSPALAISRLAATQSFKLDALMGLQHAPATPTAAAEEGLYSHTHEPFSVSASAAKQFTTTPGAEARIYCVTHVILVLSEFGTRPILHAHCSALELEFMGQLLAEWLLCFAETFPHSHAYNREIVVEICASLFICKHNGVMFAPRVLRAMAASVHLLLDDVRLRGGDAGLRKGGPTARESVFLPIIAANQARTDKGAMFAQYHTNYLVGMLLQLVIADAFGGNGRLNHPTGEKKAEHCACSVTAKAGTSAAVALYPAFAAAPPDTALEHLPSPRTPSAAEMAKIELAALSGPYPSVFGDNPARCACALCAGSAITVVPRDYAAQLASACRYTHASAQVQALHAAARVATDGAQYAMDPHALPRCDPLGGAHTDIDVAVASMLPSARPADAVARYTHTLPSLRARLGLWADAHGASKPARGQTQLRLVPVGDGKVDLFSAESSYFKGNVFDEKCEFLGYQGIKRKQSGAQSTGKRRKT